MALPNPNLRVMVDANVLVAGLGWPRWPYAVLQHAVAGDFQLVLSPYVIEEARRNLQQVAPATLLSLDEFLALSDYEAIADPTPEILGSHHQLVHDPKDVPVALAAMTAQVDCLISSDKDLTESEELKKHVAVLLPAVFLRKYMGWTSEELEVIGVCSRNGRNRTLSLFGYELMGRCRVEVYSKLTSGRGFHRRQNKGIFWHFLTLPPKTPRPQPDTIAAETEFERSADRLSRLVAALIWLTKYTTSTATAAYHWRSDGGVGPGEILPPRQQTVWHIILFELSRRNDPHRSTTIKKRSQPNA